MRLIKNILSLVALVVSLQASAQQHTTKAYAFYQSQQFDSAKFWIDSAVVSDEKTNSQTWQLKGLIYRKLESEENKEYREVAIEAFVEARKTDLDGTHKEKIDGYVYNTVIRYYNDAVTELGEQKLGASEKSYGTYKTAYLEYIDSSLSFDKNDIEFYNALGGAYLKQVGESTGEDKREKTKMGVYFFKLVLKLDSTQFQPNLNIGILYYNNGADLMMNMDPLTPIEDIPIKEATAQESFKLALPFLLEARKMDMQRTDILEAITGCYYGLLDDENYNINQKILDEKNLPELLEKHAANPKNREVVRELVRIYSTTFKNEDEYKKYVEILNNLEE